MKYTCETFGSIDGVEVFAHTLENANGMSFTAMDYGCTITKLLVRDKNDGLCDVCLGYDSLEEYARNDGVLGAAVGRCANRIGKAEFELNGKRYKLAQNIAPNHLHGGEKGFDKRIWTAAVLEDGISFSRISEDMEEGYPARVEVKITYTLGEDNSLTMDYYALPQGDTIVNLTNHSYFNLSGHGDILTHRLQINAEKFTPNDENLLPCGEIARVEGTPFDFRRERQIGEALKESHRQLELGGGLDHNYCLSGGLEETAARLSSQETGISMTVSTNFEGMQVYTANSLTKRKGKNGCIYAPRSGICFETQAYPNAVNVPDFPTVVLKKGQEYKRRTIFRFTREGCRKL